MRALRNLKQRYPVLFGVSLGALVAASAAVAAFIVYTGINGSGAGSFSSTSSASTAVTLQGHAPSSDLSPGDSTSMLVNITNNDPNINHTVTGVSASFTSSPADCASHLQASGLAELNGQVVPSGTTLVNAGPIMITADPGLPADCLSGSYTINFTGTTNP